MPQKPLDISTSLFYPHAEEQQHHFRVSSRMMPMPPGYTKVFGFAPTWCTTKYLARSCGVFFIAVFRKSRSLVHHRGREELVYFRLSKKRLVGRALLARARLSVKKAFQENALLRQIGGRPMVAPTCALVAKTGAFTSKSNQIQLSDHPTG